MAATGEDNPSTETTSARGAVTAVLEEPWFADERSGAHTLPQRIFVTLEDPASSKGGRYIGIGVLLLIALSSIAFVVEAEPSVNYVPDECLDAPYDDRTPEDCEPVPHEVFGSMETIAIAIFSVEYLGRVLTVWSVPPELANIRARGRLNPLTQTWRYCGQKLNLVDAAAILPYYIGLLVGGGGSGLAVLRILRLARVFRVLKVGKHAKGAAIFGRVIAKSVPALYLLAFFLLLAAVLFGSLAFFAEGGEYVLCAEDEDCVGRYVRVNSVGDGKEPTPFTSITRSIWWVLVTTTTVGYGDLYPTGLFGKLVALLTMHAGILFLAMPITIVGANFANEYAIEQENDKREAAEAQRRATLSSRELLDVNDPKNRRRKLAAEVLAIREALEAVEKMLAEEEEEAGAGGGEV